MSCTIDFKKQPKEIEIQCDGGSFTLKHVYMDADERAAAVEAYITQGMHEAQKRLWKKIIAWDGVVDPEDRPIAFEYLDGDTKKSNLAAVMGQVPFSEQVFAVAAQLAANRVNMNKIKAALTFLLDNDADIAAVEKRLADFLRTAAPAAGTSPSNSAASATSAT